MLTSLRKALSKIGNGLLYGIGIGVSAGLIMYLISEAMTAALWDDSALEKVVVSKHEEVKRGRALFILGTVENRGTEIVRMPNVQVDLFDKNGKFVEQCSEYIQGTLKPGESRNFKVSCAGCKEQPIVQHASYKVRIVGL